MKNEEWLAPLRSSFYILHSSFFIYLFFIYLFFILHLFILHSSFRNSDIFRIKSCRCDIFCVKNHKKTKIPPRFNNNHNKYQNYFINLQMQ